MHTFVRSSLVALLLGAVTAPLAAQDIRPLHSGPNGPASGGDSASAEVRLTSSATDAPTWIPRPSRCCT